MRTDDCLGRLRSLIAGAGIEPQRPSGADVERVWAIWRQFAAEPVEDAAGPEEDGDAVLAQYGIWDLGEGEHFGLDMTRQFIFNDEDGEYGGMSQLHCQFSYEPSEQLRAVGEQNMWSSGMELGAFFDEALATPGFAVVRALAVVPNRLEIEYSEV